MVTVSFRGVPSERKSTQRSSPVLAESLESQAGVEPAGSQTPSRKLSLVKCEMSPQAQVFQTWLPAAGAAREAVRAFGDTSWPEERKLRVLGSEFRLLARPILSLNY